MAPSRNDIFSASWLSADSLEPAPAPPTTDLARRRTTGPAWRRPRTIPPPADAIVISSGPAPTVNVSHGLHRGGSLREPPSLRLQTEFPAATTGPSPQSQSSRTSSFFDVSPSSGLAASSLYSARSVSTSYTNASTNASLAASLPSPVNTKPLVPIQLEFTPRPELQLGQGRFSKVYLAAYRKIDDSKEHICVVKRPEPDDDSQALALREAWFLRQLRDGSHLEEQFITRILGVEVDENESSTRRNPHTHVRSVSDSATELRRGAIPSPPRTLLLMEYYPLTLATLLHAPHKYLLTPRTFVRLATELAHALAHCHTKHILHTDLKPANVLLALVPNSDSDSPRISVRLGDFGSALHLPSLPLPPTDPAGLGTLTYSPPEFFRPPPSPFSLPSDVFSAGVTLSATLFSREPYARLGTSPRTCRQWVARGAYWTYEESERVELQSSWEDRLDAGDGNLGNEMFERVLERECSADEMESLVLSRALSPPQPIKYMDAEPYADGSAPTYFPGAGEQTGVQVRVPQDLLFLLKHMCEPIPDRRPTMDEVVHRLGAISLLPDLQ
ncbi:kinase domain protein [Rhizoctonia solani AG-3 Rhs1AP]|uniref:Kinase domain protein n=1 Tax=Rhizoctonia solani AG-3 Rhs1AP TaxID=1086054 RepID=X8JRD8_9AGAM|nr:kinase domain protein [Rhizoctonia solani AG-3 Rhs1AP]